MLRFVFQFTHPGKGATARTERFRRAYVVSIHAPWEGCDYLQQTLERVKKVSIHAPWEGCDFQLFDYTIDDAKFQFTHPGKGATNLATVTHYD